MNNESKKPKYLAHLFEILEIIPEFNEKAYKNIHKKEKELGIKIPGALKECYFFFDKKKIKDDPILYDYDDRYPNEASIIRRIKACGMDWDFYHSTSEIEDQTDENGNNIEVLQFWNDPSGACDFYCKLDGTEDPPIISVGHEYKPGKYDDRFQYYTISPSFTNFITTTLFSWNTLKYTSTAIIKGNSFQTDLSGFSEKFDYTFTNTIADFNHKNRIMTDGWGYFTHFHLFMSRNHYILLVIKQIRKASKKENEPLESYFEINWSVNGKTKQDLFNAMQTAIENVPSLSDRFQYHYGPGRLFRKFPLALNIPLGGLSLDVDIPLAERIAQYVKIGRENNLLEQQYFYDYAQLLIRSEKLHLNEFGLELIEKLDLSKFDEEFHHYLSKMALRFLLSQDEDMRWKGGRDEYIKPDDYPKLSQLLVHPLVNQQVLDRVCRVIRFHPSTKDIFIPNLIKLLSNLPFVLSATNRTILIKLHNDFPPNVIDIIVNRYPEYVRKYLRDTIALGKTEDLEKCWEVCKRK